MAAIDSNIIIMLRAVINDLDESNYTYTDERLEQIISVSAMFVNKDMDVTPPYVIDVVTPDISPNPYTVPDLSFVNLLVMKAACLLDQGTFRAKAILNGLEAKCGPATLRTLGHLDGFKELLTLGPCAAYDKMLTNYKFGDGNLCHIILSPFVNDDFNIQSFTDGNYRDFIR